MKNKDLGLKIGTKEEAFWTDVKEQTEKQLEGLRKAVKFNEAILEMAQKRIKCEKSKK